MTLKKTPSKFEVFQFWLDFVKAAQSKIWKMYPVTRRKAHIMKLKNGKFKTDKRKHYFTQCTAGLEIYCYRIYN